MKRGVQKPYERQRDTVTRKCELCRKPYEAYLERSRFCSTKCSGHVGSSSRLVIRDCEVCAAPFVAHGPNSKVCGERCRVERNRSKNRDHQRAAYGDERRRVARRNSAVRRARIAGVAVDTDITVEALHKRDGGVCQLCLEPAELIFVPGRGSRPPLMATVDHVVPIARGGSHTWGNVQLAHLICNQRKHAKENRETEAA